MTIIILGAVLYFVPLAIAMMRRHRNTLAIGLLNVFLGWTVLGWIGALIWAVIKSGKDAPGQSPPAA